MLLDMYPAQLIQFVFALRVSCDGMNYGIDLTNVALVIRSPIFENYTVPIQLSEDRFVFSDWNERTITIFHDLTDRKNTLVRRSSDCLGLFGSASGNSWTIWDHQHINRVNGYDSDTHYTNQCSVLSSLFVGAQQGRARAQKCRVGLSSGSAERVKLSSGRPPHGEGGWPPVGGRPPSGE